MLAGCQVRAMFSALSKFETRWVSLKCTQWTSRWKPKVDAVEPPTAHHTFKIFLAPRNLNPLYYTVSFFPTVSQTPLDHPFPTSKRNMSQQQAKESLGSIENLIHAIAGIQHIEEPYYQKVIEYKMLAVEVPPVEKLLNDAKAKT